MKKLPFFLLLIFATGSALRADDQLRDAQNALKEQGFYFGATDGEPGPETSAAIRRYQIRNGMDVTGTLTPELVQSLKNGGNEPAEQPGQITPTQPANPAGADREFPDNHTAPGAGTYAELFAGTPYENAPPEVQRNTLIAAQKKLVRRDFLRGPTDGVYGSETTRAILSYQRLRGIDPTGHLDMRTLSELELLPATIHGPQTQPRPVQPVPGRRIFRGIWVR